MVEQNLVENEVVMLDYAEISNKEFRNCKLVYKGGRVPKMRNVTLAECEFIFEDSASNTLQMLQLIAHNGDAALVVNGILGLTDWSLNEHKSQS